MEECKDRNNDGLPSYASSTRFYCGICTNEILPPPPTQTEKSTDKQQVLPSASRSLNCCGRVVCGDCIDENPRFGTYCPFCQSLPTKLAHTIDTSFRPLPPAYTANPSFYSPAVAPEPTTPVEHHIRPTDTLLSISLLYSLPPATLRAHNRLFADNLLHARRTLSIPYPYTGPPLSHPPTAAEAAEDERKTMLKRFQVRTKCVDFDAARVYLEEARWDEGVAVERWEDDERWVGGHPMGAKDKGKGKEKASGNKGKGRWVLRAFGY